MKKIITRLTDDKTAERMLAQIEQGYTVREWIVYIKLNQLENMLEPKNPEYKVSPNGEKYLSCPKCGKGADYYIRPKFCYNCGQALKWIDQPGGRFA